MTPGEARAQFVALALAVEGLSDAPATRERYRDAIIPCPSDRDSPVMAAAMGAMSSCGLTARGLMWRAGVRHPLLSSPYRVQMAIVDVEQIAEDCKALRPPSYSFGLGDILIVEAPEHVLTVVERVANRVTSIDGGQRDKAGYEAILRRERTYYTTGSPRLDGRPIRHVVDCVALANAEGW